MYINKTLLTLLLAAGFLAPSAMAQTAEQKAARAEIDTLTQRIEELAKKLDSNTKVQVMVIEKSANGEKSVQRRVISSSPDGAGMQWTEGKPAKHVELRHAGAPRIGLGIVMGPNPESNGAKVAAVSPKGPAKAAGLQAGDVITSVNGKAISAKDQEGMKQARAALANLKEGQSVKIGYNRAGKNATVTVKAAKIEEDMVIDREVHRLGPGSAPEIAFATRWHGLQLAELNPQLGRYFGTNSGVLVLNSKKEFSQLQAGDVITKVNGNTVTRSRDVLVNMRGKKEGEKIGLDIVRDRKTQSITVTAPKPQPMNAPMPPKPPMPPAPPAPPAPPRTALFHGEDGETSVFKFVLADVADGLSFADIDSPELIDLDDMDAELLFETDIGD